MTTPAAAPAAVPPGQLELYPTRPGRRSSSYRVAWIDSTSGSEAGLPGPSFTAPIRDLPIAAGRAHATALAHGRAWIVAADGTSTTVEPDGTVHPACGWAASAARVLDHRKDPSMTPDTPAASAVQLIDVELDRIIDHPHNIRRELRDLDDLAASIDLEGVLIPCVVLPADADGMHVLVDGHRRRAAAEISQSRPALPCLVRDLDERQVIEAMLTTGIQRSDISPVEEARGYHRLVELDTSIADIADRMGRSQKHIKARIGLLQLPAPVLDEVHTGRMTLACAEASTRFVDDDAAAADLADTVASGRWSNEGLVNQIENRARDRARKAELTAALDQLDADGLRRWKPTGYWHAPSALRSLSDPHPVEVLGFTTAQATKHRGEPCHAVYVEPCQDWDSGIQAYRHRIEITPMCLNPRHHTTSLPEADRSSLQMKPDHYEGLLAAEADDKGRAAQRGKAAAEAEAARAARDAATLARQTWILDRVASHPKGLAQPTHAAAAALTALDSDWAITTDSGPGAFGYRGDLAGRLADQVKEWSADPDEVIRYGDLIAAVIAELAVTDALSAACPSRDVVAAVAWYDVLLAAGYEPTEFESEQIATWRRRLDDEATERAATAAMLANPTADDAARIFDELTPEAICTLAETLFHHEHPDGPEPNATLHDLIDLEEQHLVAKTSDEDGGRWDLTDFAHRIKALADEHLGGFQALADQAADAASFDQDDD